MRNKKAESGIGTLIIFIALIVIAAVAAGVLLQTSSSLQSKALATGSAARVAVSSNVIFLQAYMVTNGTTQAYNQFYVDIKLAAGSDPIDINSSLIRFDLTDAVSSLSYNATNSGSDCSPPTTLNRFNIFYITTNPTTQAGFLQSSDSIRLCFTTPRLMRKFDEYSFRFTPQQSTGNFIKGRIPEIISQESISVYP